jgi:hypothetical protein
VKDPGKKNRCKKEVPENYLTKAIDETFETNRLQH